MTSISAFGRHRFRFSLLTIRSIKTIVELGKRAQEIAAGVDLPSQSFQALRRRVRTALDDAGLTSEWEAAVEALFTSQV